MTLLWVALQDSSSQREKSTIRQQDSGPVDTPNESLSTLFNAVHVHVYLFLCHIDCVCVGALA